MDKKAWGVWLKKKECPYIFYGSKCVAVCISIKKRSYRLFWFKGNEVRHAFDIGNFDFMDGIFIGIIKGKSLTQTQ